LLCSEERQSLRSSQEGGRHLSLFKRLVNKGAVQLKGERRGEELIDCYSLVEFEIKIRWLRFGLE
jgi:hypothetical protein